MFLLLVGLVQKTLLIPWFLLPEAKHIVNTVVWGFRAAKISVFTVFFAPRVSKKRENTTYLTIFGHYGTEKKAARGNSGSNNNNNNNNHNELYDQSVASQTSTTKNLREYTR